MATVEPLFAQWLQSDADFATGTSAVQAARWGEAARKTERVTGIARKVDAQAEIARELVFLARGPFGEDVHQLVGTDWDKRRGQVIVIENDQLGYAGGVEVFVLEAEVDRAAGISTVTVLCPLEGTQ